MNEPAQQKCGAPDFVVSKKRKDVNIPIGYIEAKDITVSLDATDNKDQLKRYLDSLDNLIHTDYLEFRFYKERELVATVRIADLIDGQIIPKVDSFSELETLLANFAEYIGQTIKSPRVLAEMMARKARLMRDVFFKAVSNKDIATGLHEQLEAFRKILIHDMDEEQFADVYAQTIAYGLFTARLHDNTLEDFSRQEARDLIPRSNPFLRQLFDYVCGADMDQGVAWIIDELCEVYRATNIANILSDFNKDTGRNDPIVHFYETFLGEYDPKLRKARGVWYTPESVVNFIVRAIDEVLKTHFNINDGILDTSKVTIEVDSQEVNKKTKDKRKHKEKREVHRVQMLDIATGTGSFMAEVVKQIHGQFIGQQGMWSNYVEEHLLPRLHGFEILMASYAMCHLKLDLLLTETGYKPSNPKHPPRLGAYLANSLEEHHPDVGTLFASWLAKEANEASHIKSDTPVMIAFGNPPYSGQSSNNGEWISKLIEGYKKEPGGKIKLQERNPKMLNDDYVKFIRLGEHYVERNGEGVLAYITNNGYLDNPTFRGMRWHLLNTFDDIYVLDLHGNSKKKEVCEDGSPDKNVFDIMQGVSIIVAVKTKAIKDKGALAQVHHHSLKGSRKGKYDFLWDQSLKTIPFKKLPNKDPHYFFIPKDYNGEEEYNEGFGIYELFKIGSAGIVTFRDKLTIHHSREGVSKTINDFASLEAEDARQKYSLGKDSQDWQVLLAQEDILSEGFSENMIRTLAYRPFDMRQTYYTGKSKGLMSRPRFEIMKHFLQNNFALSCPKQTANGETSGGIIVKDIVAHKVYSAYNPNYAFPLYLYPDENAEDELALSDEEVKRKPNLDDKIVQKITKGLGLKFIPDHEDAEAGSDGTFTPLDLLDYIYAVLHSPNYRETWKEFLKIDFPRVPYPESVDKFWSLVALGREIRLLHLMEHASLATPITSFDVGGDNMVEKPSFAADSDTATSGKVHINKEQYFDAVPKIAWEFHIGGYQPAQKWLKDRKGRALSFDDIRHYGKIIVALTKTHRLMQEIDAVGLE